MKMEAESVSSALLEISSEQRLNIILKLHEKKYTISSMAKELDATAPEIHRNLSRLSQAGLIKKDAEGGYELTPYGKVVHTLVPSYSFIVSFRKYFDSHGFGNIPDKFIQRIGNLESAKHIKGFVKVLEEWKNIHQNSNKYIYNILYEVPYSQDIIEIVAGKLEKNVNVKSIFSEEAIIPEERKKSFEKHNIKKFILEGMLERKMIKDANIILLLNEHESCVMFPKSNGEPDMSEMLYSKDPVFHDWCYDYFMHCWNISTAFQESKIKN